MRDLSATTDTAIDTTRSYQIVGSALVEPSLAFVDTFTDNNPIASSDAVGLVDDPVLQDIGYSPSGYVVTFFNDGGALKYRRQGSSTTVTVTSGAMMGKPGVYGDYIYIQKSSQILSRFTINWTNVGSGSASILGSESVIYSHLFTNGVVHGVSDTRCVIIEDDDGGLRVHLHVYSGSWTKYTQPYRFMFPKSVKYADTERSALGLATHSTALEINGDVFAYISNNFSGGVEGVQWDADTEVFGDVFVAIPSDIDADMSEFRVANSYVHSGTAYIVGQFKRKENADDDANVRNLILRSVDGRIYSFDRFTAVSNLGYRLLGLVGDDLNLYLSGCNRVTYTPATWVFVGSSGSGGSLDIPGASIVSYRDDNCSKAELRLESGSESLLYHSYIKPGSRVTVYQGYRTALGEEKIVYGTYIIDQIFSSAFPERSRSLSLVNQSDWLLQNMSSPLYTEIISKSSLYVPFDEENGYLVTSGSCGEARDGATIDFWNPEGFDDATLGITAIELNEKGGVNYGTHTAGAKVGLRTKDLMTVTDLEDYPIVTATTVTARVYGWSHPDSGSVNDVITLLVWYKSPSGDTGYVSATGSRWPNTYPSGASGDWPIVYNLTMNVGDKITQVGIAFECASATEFCPARVEFSAGVISSYTLDGNTGWTQQPDGGLKLPGYLRPYIMFSRKPYHAFNFQVSASFTDTVADHQTTHTIAWGLVGLAIDGSNYVCGRYNKSTDRLEIVKVRNRFETVLTSGSHATPVTATTEIMFEHHDGTFSVRLKDNTGAWTLNLSYDWQASDGWMFESKTQSMHCGIYGIIDQPNFITTGYDPGSDQDSTNADGIPMMPWHDLDILDDFPSSGTVAIENNVYTYTSKLKPTEIRGPYQFRQNDVYDPPFGTGDPGLETRDFDWSLADGAFTGYFAAVDDGGVYEMTGSEWQVFITTGGSTIYLPHRARYYAGNKIAETYHDLGNRVYVTGGLKGVATMQGDAAYHVLGEAVRWYTTGEIICNYFSGHSGDYDASIHDLIDRVAKTAGASVQFPGDLTIDSLTLSSGSYGIGIQYYPNGLDLRFTLDPVTYADYFDITLDAGYGTDTEIKMRMLRVGGGQYQMSLILNPSGTFLERYNIAMADTEHAVRVFFHDQYATFYIDGRWIHSFSMPEIPTYANSMRIGFFSSITNHAVRDLTLIELSDWREAIYIDLETNSKSAIGSVVQERPVEIIAKSDGSIAFWYEITRSINTLSQYNLRSHTWQNNSVPEGSSDAIVYYDLVKVLQDEEYLSLFGFSTRIYRMPSLSHGAVRAAYILLKRLRQQREIHDFIIRPDVRIEAGDVLNVDYLTPGTKRNNVVSIIVQSVTNSWVQAGQGGQPSMKVSGRLNI